MRQVGIAVTAAFVALGLALPAAAEIAIGTRIPSAFLAKDSSGRTRTFANLTGRRGVVLVFHRSARWCPYCQAQLKSLKDIQPTLAQKGYALAALSYDPPAALSTFAQKTGVAYPLLSDEKSAMIDAFGLRDPSYAAGSFAHGVPRATILIIDAQGIVRWKSVAVDYKIRADNAAILRAVDRVDGA
jgi:peroxiredoxin